MLEADDSGLVLVLERALPLAMADQVAAHRCPVEEAIEIAGGLARRLAVHPLPSIKPLTDTVELGRPAERADRRASRRSTCAGAGTSSRHDPASGYRRNIDRVARRPALREHPPQPPRALLDHRPEGRFGTVPFDAFTVVAGGREELRMDDGLHGAIK